MCVCVCVCVITGGAVFAHYAFKKVVVSLSVVILGTAGTVCAVLERTTVSDHVFTWGRERESWMDAERERGVKKSCMKS